MSGLGNERSAPASASGATALPDLEFTGERLVPGKTVEPLFREHEERYIFAGRYVQGKDVLDVASGSGVGSAYLRDAGARSVRGFDIDPQAVAFAAARYTGCSFAVCSATELALPAASIDVVVSFETVEHLSDQETYIRECRRVLKPGGIFICSTPNTRLNSRRCSNEFHVHELPLEEFQSLLAASFGHIELFSQSERIYPVFIAKRLVASTLGAVGLLNPVSALLGNKRPGGPMRERFGGDSAMCPSIAPLRSSALFQPMFMIAVAREPLKPCQPQKR